MSGQFPGHSRPPVGTPPPQTVWNHLAMAQGQVSGLNMNIHPTSLSGASMNPANFYTHPTRTSHLTPQLAHTHMQSPPTWHTPTLPTKSVTPGNSAASPIFNLQKLVDNRQNQSQYHRTTPNVQSTLDLSATSEMAENYSRLPQDIPISLTARSVDKGSRNGNIISPPIPLNGDTSSDSGISCSISTANSLADAATHREQQQPMPKISVKIDGSLKSSSGGGGGNLHEKIKEMCGENFGQTINLPSSVTIERITTTEKKEDHPSLNVIAQALRNVMPVIVNLTSKDSEAVGGTPNLLNSKRDVGEDVCVRSPKNLSKRSRKGVDYLLEKLEGGNNKKLGSCESIGSVIVTPVEDKDSSSVKSMSPERHKSKSPSREDEVISPSFSNEDSNDNTKQRRKRKLEKPVRLSSTKDSKTELEDMELDTTEPTEARSCQPIVVIPDDPVTTVPKITITPETATSTSSDQSSAPTTTTAAPADDTSNKNIVLTEKKDEENPSVSRRSRNSDTLDKTDHAGQTPESLSTTTVTHQRTRRKSEGEDVTDGPQAKSATTTAAQAATVTSPNSANNSSNANPFNQVESELEKMFAGIVEDCEDPALKTEATDNKSMLESLTTSTPSSNDMSQQVVEVKKEDENSTNLEDNSNQSNQQTANNNKKSKKKGQGTKRKLSKGNESSSSKSGESPSKAKKKKGASKSGNKKQQGSSKKPGSKNLKSEGVKEGNYDSGSNASSSVVKSRGPVVHVEGPRDSPLSIQVVNGPREEEEEKRNKSLGNGNANRSKRLSHHNDLDYRGNKVNKDGLFSSTLSSRYDAHTTDSSWVCVFCKQGPHSVISGDPLRPHPNIVGPHIAPGTYTAPAGVLSDLFGPYLIGLERLEDNVHSADEQEITTEQKKGSKNKRSLRHAGLADQFSAKMGKKKKNAQENSVNAVNMFAGMTLLSGEGEEQRWEVWLHEQCVVWAAGVYMAGGRVTGLQEAVWDAAKSVCDACGLTGANIGCVKRGCKTVTHYPCALTKGWHLDDSHYIPKCSVHRAAT